ncbi:hypothetical protein Pcinc_011655 [Petrolisthes cinctipes]|uniref:Sulfotransferase domain-containing protein n=1 Tax=Petrolisthes cinctipes TaxID=88211 RepID=A0AAE1KU76_PETCI|nr:hypothetical protein Pcinc_011655 [Petrolisthes cinctipes]
MDYQYRDVFMHNIAREDYRRVVAEGREDFRHDDEQVNGEEEKKRVAVVVAEGREDFRHDEEQVNGEEEKKRVVVVGNNGFKAGPQKNESSAYRTLQQVDKGPSHSWWKDDPQCSRLDVRYGQDLTPTLLQSYPRSGNTWVRYLLEGATGIFTSSVYKDFTLIRAGYLGERSKIWYRNTIVTKIHFVKHLQKFADVPAIIIIRNPARVLVSLWSYVNIKNRQRKHVAVMNPESFNTSAFHAFVGPGLKKWLWTTRESLTNKKRRLLVLYFEDIRANPTQEVRKMLQFLKVWPDEKRLSCLERNLEGKVKSVHKTLDPFTQEEQKDIDRAVAEINRLLTDRGLQPLPDYHK